MASNQREAIEPWWPWGSVAELFPGKHGESIGIGQLAIRQVEPIDGGYRVTAGRLGDRVFEVDEHGESAQCDPWEDIIEQQFAPDAYVFDVGYDDDSVEDVVAIDTRYSSRTGFLYAKGSDRSREVFQEAKAIYERAVAENASLVAELQRLQDEGDAL